MADTGFIDAGTAAGNRTGGTVDWVNPDNAKTIAALNATVTVNINTSRGLALTNFGFGALIPVGSTIDGIEVAVDNHVKDVGDATWTQLRLILADDTNGAENKASELTQISTIQTIGDTAGGPTDLWSETITRDDVIDVDWGAFAQVFNDVAANSTVSIDRIAMRIFYTPGPSGDPPTSRRRHLGYSYG